MSQRHTPELTSDDRRELASAFGYDRPTSGDGPTLKEIRAEVRTETAPELDVHGSVNGANTHIPEG